MEVVFIYHTFPHYRKKFYELVRQSLQKKGVTFRLLYGTPAKENRKKKDLVSLPWAEPINTTWLGNAKTGFCFNSVLGKIKSADLVIIYQENKILENYPLQLYYLLGGKKVAFFGHGKTPPYSPSQGFLDRWKRFWIPKVHWWFAYTEGVADIVAETGFPRERITVFNNSIDTSAILQEMDTVAVSDLDEVRKELNINSENIGIYIGGMYKNKRLDFLIDAALLIREKVPDFELLLIGAGEDAPIAETAAKKHEFIHYLGPKFGIEKTKLAMISKVFLMPGLVGLAIIDAFAYKLPMVTTSVDYHSPEIDYLKDGVNGVIVDEHDSPLAYANAVLELLKGDSFRDKIIAQSQEDAKYYTIENMADRFATGVLKALN